MENKNCACPKHIKGIVCNVKNCIHHDCHDCCTADEIAVGPAYAECSAETICVTFRPRQEG